MTTYNTGNPIGSTEVKDLYDNAQNFDTLANTTTLETVPDRLGVPRMTLHGFEQEANRRFESIKFQPPIPYAPGIEVTTSSLTVDYLGVLYYALPSALPFTTGAWNPAQWSPLQNTVPGNELLVFNDYASASAAAATLPDWQKIIVEVDETVQGSPPYKYTVLGGILSPDGYASALKLPFGSKTQGVYYRYGKIYESNGTVEKNETRPWLHDFRPTVADGSDFNTDGANLFIGHGAGNFTMKAVPIGMLPGGKDYSLQCSHNIGFGIQALGSLTIGYKNTGIGTNAFRKLTEGHGNTALGRDAGHELTTGNENVSLGFTAGQLAQTGNYNTSVGTSSFYNNAGGSGNVALGRRAAFSFTSGNYNVAVGEQAATGHLSGDYNTIIGKQVANNGITTGSSNTVIGARVTGLEDASGQVVLASGDGTKLLEINPNGTGKSKLDLVSKNTTAVNLAATDGQVDAGSTLVLRSAANVGSAITQIAFQSRTGQPWSRLVSWGGATPNISIVTNNAESARWNSSGDLIQKVNAAAPALVVNSTMTFELTSNTELKIKVRGSDGVTRSASIALA